MSRRVHGWLAAALLLALVGCDKPQTLDADAKKVDTKAWEAGNNPYLANGWKSGDKTSWDEQLRLRAQAQNEYARTK